MNRNMLVGVGLLIGLAIVAAVLVNTVKKPATSSPAPTTQAQMTTQEASAPAVTGEVKEITVSGNEYSYMPNSLTLTKGETVKLTLKNTGNLPHNLVVDELGVATKTIKGGDSDTVTFTADKSGTFKFYCSIGNHRAKGMEGTATIQ